MNRAAIVGAGPAGFYAADQLLKAGFEVDLFDALPTPFGLVRAGVAPDHPKIKSVTRMYAKTALHDAFRFFGAVTLGAGVSREDLLARYHAVVYAIGTAVDNRLGIPGEDRPGSHAATEFVAWYNGHPHFADHNFDLNGGRAVVVGNGNVAIDVARMLVLDPGELAPTDTADHALDAFGMAGVTEVVLLGRRGPAEVAFTNPELRELGELARADVIVDPAQLEGVEAAEDADTTRRRNVEILREYAQRTPAGKSHRLELRFLRSPVEIMGDGEDGPVTGVRVAINRLVAREDGRIAAEPTGEEEVIECGLVLRSIGYRGTPVAGVPFDERRGLIRNDGGRVRDDAGRCAGEYVVGWIKRGPSGVIGTNKKDAADTVARILEDEQAGALGVPDPALADPEAIAAWLTERMPGHVTWAGWEAIDQLESELGAPAGRPRVKLVRLDELVDASRGQRR
ncbi:MAG TPA: FAD-dependent oxidoreductase [Solirubrobacteraceae bacterium]|jgi:ferredoxin--NADP+ reductase|nr:FAD-dependent oxidoreductase [Solirubrobacteraceae bacterium]